MGLVNNMILASLLAMSAACVPSHQSESAVATDGQACATLDHALTPAGGGPPGSTGFANSCCAGLTHVESKDMCGEAYGGYSGQCLACGDGKCDSSLENQCNCAQDCKTAD